MGADGLCHTPSGAAYGTSPRWLTWENGPEQQAGNAPGNSGNNGNGHGNNGNGKG